MVENQLKKNEIILEGIFYLRQSWWTKTKIFASILKDKPCLYYTNAKTLAETNNVMPIHEPADLPKAGWT